MQAVQTPEWVGGLLLLTGDFVRAAHGRNLRVHAWTVNDEAAMRRLLALGVDGVMTDYPDRLLKVLGRGGARSAAPETDVQAGEGNKR